MNLNQVLWPRGCRPLLQADQCEDRRTDKEGEAAAARGETFSHFQLWKGLFTNFFYCSNPIFGSINAQNSTFLGFHFVPRALDSRRNRGPRLAAHGTSTRSAGDLDSRRQGTSTSSAKGPRLAAPMMRDLSKRLKCAVTRGTPSLQGTSTRGINLSRVQQNIYWHRWVEKCSLNCFTAEMWMYKSEVTLNIK